LGTVDCARFPDATDALITALRGDPNECVRYAAARVLSNGCCCSKKTIDALTITTLGPAAFDPVKQKTPDNKPPENSERVRCAAMIALQGCLAVVPPDLPPVEELPKPLIEDERPTNVPKPKPEDEGPSTIKPTAFLAHDHDVQQVAYEKMLSRKPMSA